MPTVEWKVTGMHCGSCESLIKDILSDFGVKEASISAKTGKLIFPGEKAPLDKIKSEIQKEGYKVSVWK